MSREELAADPSCEREVLLKDRLKAAMLRLKEWMTGEQAPRVIFDLKHMDALGVAGNQAVHECLTYGMNVAVDVARGPDTRTARFCDFDHPEGGLNNAVSEGATGRPHMATCLWRHPGLGKTTAWVPAIFHDCLDCPIHRGKTAYPFQFEKGRAPVDRMTILWLRLIQWSISH